MFWSVAEAKSKFSELIKLVQAGVPAVITSHGVPVARLLPPSMSGVYAHRLAQLQDAMGGPTVSQMAETMGLPKAGELASFFEGTAEPEFAFLDSLAERFHLSKEWLKHGKTDGRIWEPIDGFNGDRDFFRVGHALRKIERLAPREIIFVREDHRGQSPHEFRGEALVVLKWDDLTYQAFGTTIPVSRWAQRTANNLWGLCELSVELPKREGWSVIGKVVSSALLEEIRRGERWPGAVEQGAPSVWWHDLNDYRHDPSRRAFGGKKGASYGRNYGQSFLDAQGILSDFERLIGQQPDLAGEDDGSTE